MRTTAIYKLLVECIKPLLLMIVLVSNELLVAGSGSSNRSLGDTMSDPMGEYQAIVSNLSAAALKYIKRQLPVKTPTVNEESVCSICYDRECDTTLNCPGAIKHTFCKACITEVFKKDLQQRCPLCRQSTLKLLNPQEHIFDFSLIAPQFRDQIERFIYDLTDLEYTSLMTLYGNEIENQLLAHPEWIDDTWLSRDKRMAYFRRALDLTDEPIEMLDDLDRVRKSTLRLQENQRHMRRQLPPRRYRNLQNHSFIDHIKYVAPELRQQVENFMRNLSDKEYKALMGRYGHAAEVEVSEHEEWLNTTLPEQTRKNYFHNYVGLSSSLLDQNLPQWIIDRNLLRFIKNNLYTKVILGNSTEAEVQDEIQSYEGIFSEAQLLEPE